MAYDPNQPRDALGRWTVKGASVSYTEFRQNTSYSLLGNISRIQDIQPIDIEVDEIVPCLRDTNTGELVDTEVAMVPRKELKRYHSKNGWCINWSKRPADEEVFGVYLKDDMEPQGLISLRYDIGGTYIGFVCAAPHNNKQMLNGKSPKYTGVGGHLFAVAVEQSLSNGGDGVVHGYANNSRTLKHYVDAFGAKNFPIIHEYQFIIEGESSRKLLETYNYMWR